MTAWSVLRSWRTLALDTAPNYHLNNDKTVYDIPTSRVRASIIPWENLDPGRLAHYRREVRKNGSVKEPVHTIYDGKDDVYYVTDGHHRTAAHYEEEKPTIPGYVHARVNGRRQVKSAVTSYFKESSPKGIRKGYGGR